MNVKLRYAIIQSEYRSIIGSNFCRNIVAILAIVAIFSRESQGSTNILTTFVAGGVVPFVCLVLRRFASVETFVDLLPLEVEGRSVDGHERTQRTTEEKDRGRQSIRSRRVPQFDESFSELVVSVQISGGRSLGDEVFQLLYMGLSMAVRLRVMRRAHLMHNAPSFHERAKQVGVKLWTSITSQVSGNTKFSKEMTYCTNCGS